jgi:ribosome biogenesis GTPase A
MQSEDLLAALARQRGLVQTGGRVDLQKAAEVLLKDFRAGALGRVTLETPEAHTALLRAGEASEVDRLERKAGRSRR